MTAALRLRVLPRFPARIEGQDGVKVTRATGSPDLNVSLDFENLGDIAGIPDPAQNYFAMWDAESETYVRIPFQAMVDATGVSTGYPTVTAAELAVIPAPVHAVYVFGDTAVGDGLGGLYIDSDNGSADTFVSAGGTSRTWYRAVDIGQDRIVGATAVGKSILSAALTADVRNIIAAPTYISDRAALKALDTTKDTVALLKEAGRQGTFKWTSGDFSTQIAADTQEGIYIKADAIAATSGAWVRVFDGNAMAKWFGAVADGVTADNTAISVMAAVLGYVNFSSGNHLMTTATISVPTYYEVGGAITAESGQTITLTDRITSPDQQIFKGDGDYRINIVTPDGEDARDIEAAWFGVFPTNTSNVDQQPAIQKALNAFSAQTREGILSFDQGSYHVHSSISVPRGVHVKGKGTRRTIFDVTGSAYDVFVTADDACKFSDFQFEQPSGSVAYRTGALIKLNHNACEVDNIWLWNSEFGVVINGDNCSATRLRGTYAVAMSAGSAVVQVNKGGATVKDLAILSTGGPEALVQIGKDAAANFSIVSVSGLQTNGPSIPVLINPDEFIVSRVNVADAIFSGSGGTTIDAIVKAVTTGTGGINGLTVEGAQGNANCSAVLRIDQGSSGITENVVLDDSVISGAGASAIILTQTAGTLRDITIGDTVEGKERTALVTRSGTMSNIRVSPLALSNAQPTLTYGISSLADDTATSIDLGRSFFSGSVEITAGTARHGIFTVRAQASPAVSANRITDANTVAVATTLSGTTGTDGNLTLGVQNGVLYVENRLGSSQNISVTVKAP